MKFKNIIFDFDGTLVDTASPILATMRQTIAELGLPERNEDECRATIGLRLEDIPAVLWPDIEDLSERYSATYRRVFEDLKTKFDVKPYPGVVETLRQLHNQGVNMAIASSRNRSSLMQFVNDLGIAEYFHALIGGGDVKKGKPAPEPVNKILREQNWRSEETLTVGDMDVDILMGSRAGTKTCALTYGNGSPETLREADYLIHSFPLLLSL